MHNINLCGNCGQEKPAGSLYDLCEDCAQKEGWSTLTERTFTCPFCKATANETDAIYSGWAPYYWDEVSSTTKETPVCVACTDSVLAYSEADADFYLPRPNAHAL